VSGGSLASSYFATQKPGGAVPVLDAAGKLTPQYRSFFDRYRLAMAENFQRSIVLRQFFKVRWFNSNQRATSLAEVLDDRYLDGVTLQQFYERERRGDSPRLILNSTLYNNGQRFVTSTIPTADFRYDFIPKLQQELKQKSPSPRPLPPSLQQAEGALNPLSFADFHADPRSVPLAVAVAASASFPFFVGPITVQVAGDDSYYHAGDGGLFDNQGTESLVQLYLKKIESGAARRALVVAFDSSFPFWVKNDVLDHIKNGFDIFVKDSGRIVGIMEQRANAYQALVWHILQSQQVVLPDETVIKVIVIRHTEDVWPEDWQAAIPTACREEGAAFTKREDLMQRLALVPTLFKITSDCDKALLSEAARRGVDRKRGEILTFLGRS
jgi:hypothetical protein